MLKLKQHSGDITIHTMVTSNEHQSDGGFYVDKLLNSGLESAINPIIDGEIAEYKPDYQTLNFKIFFLKFFTQSEISEFRQYSSTHFSEHVNKSKIDLGLVNTNNSTISRVIRQPFEHLQDNQTRQVELKSERGKTRLQQLTSKPYIVRNKLGLINTKRPSLSGVPIFYDSFMIPFWKKNSEWIMNADMFNKSPYLYNSLLFMEVYDSNDFNRKRVLSVPIYVNKRYNTNEQLTKLSVIKPEFNLIDGVEGFNLFLLKNYNISEFYVRFSFWDALNGIKISLLPSTPNMTKQKWIQNPNTFKNESIYLKYVLNRDVLTYNLYGYNTDTNSYDLTNDQFDLYELFFDEFWDNTIVTNTPASITPTQTVESRSTSNPFVFNIKNLKEGVVLKQNFNFHKWVIPDIGEEVLRETLLNIQRQKPKSFLFINESFDSERLYYEIANFSFKNATTDTWLIRKVELRDIVVTKDDIDNSVVIYNSTVTGGRPHKYQTASAVSVLKYSDDYYNTDSSMLKYILGTTNCFHEIIDRLLDEYITTYIQNISTKIPITHLINTFVGGGSNVVAIRDISEFFSRLSKLLPITASVVTKDLVNYIDVEFLKSKNLTNLTIYNKVIDLIIKYNKEKKSTNNAVVKIINDVQNKYSTTIPSSWRKETAFRKYFNVNSLDDDNLFNLNNTSFIGKIPNDISPYSCSIIFSTHTGVDFYVRPNKTVRADLVFIVGGKILHTFIDTQKVNISGSAVISVENSNTRVEKNIIIPIDLKLTTA